MQNLHAKCVRQELLDVADQCAKAKGSPCSQAEARQHLADIKGKSVTQIGRYMRLKPYPPVRDAKKLRDPDKPA